MNIHIAEKDEIEKAFALRFEVFVDEQNVPADIELDGEDEIAVHIIAENDDVVVGCARVIFCDSQAHVGRLAVKKLYRGKGIGASICRFIIDIARERQCDCVWLNSQLHAVGFYEKLGFLPIGDTFREAGIEHTRMELDMQNS